MKRTHAHLDPVVEGGAPLVIGPLVALKPEALAWEGSVVVLREGKNRRRNLFLTFAFVGWTAKDASLEPANT